MKKEYTAVLQGVEAFHRQVARVSGMLDSVTVSNRSLELRVEGDQLLRGFAASCVHLNDLKPLLGGEVVVEGDLSFRPSGKPLRIEVHSISAATAADAVWKHLVLPEQPTAPTTPPNAPSGLDALFGQWPGDESDEQLASALRELG